MNPPISPVTQRGGARPGAGRKPKAEKYATAIARAEKKIVDRLPELLDNLFELAGGVVVQDTGMNGEPKVYTRPPDRAANEYLIDRILGKPTASVEAEVSGPNGGPVPLAFAQALETIYGNDGAGGDAASEASAN